jgi:hypothetical protein
VTAGDFDPATLFYLFALEWLPRDDKDNLVPVPNGWVTGNGAYANLLQCALWDLQAKGLVELELVRPFEPEPMRVLGGASFVNVHVLDPAARAVGIEGLVLATAQRLEPPDGVLEKLVHGASGDHHRGLRTLVKVLTGESNRPWPPFAAPAFHALEQAGLIARKGRIAKRIEAVDAAGIVALRPRFEELRVQRVEAMQQHEALTHAVIGDGMYGYEDAYTTPM